MDKTTDRTKRFVRFLREREIKYIYTKEALRYAYRKRYECEQFGDYNLLNDSINGNLLKFFDILFLKGHYTVISRSFVWFSTENDFEFWMGIEEEWELYYRHNN